MSSLHSCLINVFNICIYNNTNLMDKLIDWLIYRLEAVIRLCDVSSVVWTSNVMLVSLNNFQSLHKYLSKDNQRITCDLLLYLLYITHIILMANIMFHRTQIDMLQHICGYETRKWIDTRIAFVNFFPKIRSTSHGSTWSGDNILELSLSARLIR